MIARQHCAAARRQVQAAILPLDPIRVARRCFVAAGLSGEDLALALSEFQAALVATFGNIAEGSISRREAVLPEPEWSGPMERRPVVRRAFSQ